MACSFCDGTGFVKVLTSEIGTGGNLITKYIPCRNCKGVGFAMISFTSCTIGCSHELRR